MPGPISSITHRHDRTAGLVLEVGKPVPGYYGRPGRIVAHIDPGQGPTPWRVVLDDSEVIFVASEAVSSMSTGEASNA